MVAGPRIEVVGATVRHGATVALDALSTTVDAGTSVALIGPNGSGKSTLLRLLAGLDEPSAGTVSVTSDGVAIVLQSTPIDRTLPVTVRDVVRMGRFAARGPFGRISSEDRTIVDEAMRRLEVADLAGRAVQDLSGGQRQRALVAQGLAQQAEVLLLDEPVTGLDIASRQVILEVIDSERRAGHIVVMSTHDLDEARRCDRVLLLATGCLADGTPDEVLTETNLRRAFGGRVVPLGDGGVLLDDPHHHHGHGHGHGHAGGRG